MLPLVRGSVKQPQTDRVPIPGPDDSGEFILYQTEDNLLSRYELDRAVFVVVLDICYHAIRPFGVSLAMNDVTRLLSQIDSGDAAASEQLLPLVYDELRRLATHKLACENPGQTLQATALVHEAYLRLVDGQKFQNWDSRGHFFAAAAEAMRRILVDQARRKNSRKRGGQQVRVNLDDLGNLAAKERDSPADLLALDDALRQLESEDETKARLVTLRYFAGLSVDQAAEVLGISPATAKRYWIYARSWLYGKLQDDDR